MKINRSMVAAVLMTVGSFSAMGCNKGATPSAQDLPATPAQASATADQPAPSPAPAPAPVAATPAPVKAASIAPVMAAAPSPGFFTGPIGLAAPFAPPPVRFENPGVSPRADYTFVRGFWKFDGHDYHWVPGRWMARRDADNCERPTYVKLDGRWMMRPERWADRHDRDRDRRGGVTVSVGVRGHV